MKRREDPGEWRITGHQIDGPPPDYLEERYWPVLPVDSDHPEFLRGLQAGMLWEAVQHDRVVTMKIRADLAEMVLRIATAVGRPFSAEPLAGDRLDVTIGAA